ncbi:hypothetical protein NDR89_15570 [Cupriavidus gilardii]|uniref:Uncharacterized protein n=1 Tax=Cupriavidus gilardii TaxID=82541 RepID=A0ABY4VW05_9BURK|nr:hypothetical protein [Cupriavidus gilardii]USE81138.1 hypothetical protein NDR89_15570 [Cupriavidus gilardii]
MALSLPHGAKPILEARMRAGAKPSDMVIVSLVGRLDEGNPVVVADGPEYDWRFLRGLQVCLFGKPGTPNRQVAIAIGACLPERLWLWDVESKKGADVIAHVRLEAIDLPHKELRKVSNWTAILSPWVDWQNRRFEECVCN